MKAHLQVSRSKASRSPAPKRATKPSAKVQRPLPARASTRDADKKSRAEMIAEAAYFKAELRGFTPGDDWRDWFDAERDFMSARKD